MRWASIGRELRQRKLVQWGLGYIAGAWVLLEISEFLSTTFSWPAPVLRVLTVVVGFAFLAVLVIAWYHGEKGHQRITTAELALLTLLATGAAAVAWRIAIPPVQAESVSDIAGAPTRLPVSTLAGSAVDSRKGIAVRPFTNLSADQDNEYFSDGITEDIIAGLSQISGLRVISRTSVMQYKNTEKTIRQIGRELGVDYVLEGSVRRSGDQVRVVAQLIDAQTDAHVWTESYNHEVRDILAVQAQVAEQIAGALSAELSPVQLAELRERQPVDPAAYELYAQGVQVSTEQTPEGRAKAADLFEQALAIDSSLVIAYSALAETLVPDTRMVGAPPQPPMSPRVEVALRRALERHPRSAGVQTFVIRRAIEERDLPRAESMAKRAIEENPNHGGAHHAYGLLLARAGRYDEALERMRHAQSLDPRSVELNTDLGELLYAMGRFDEAIAQLGATLAIDPGSAAARMNLGLAHHANGERERAEAELRRAAALSHGHPVVQGYLGFVLAAAGKRDEAARILSGMMAQEHAPQPASAIAQVLVGMGEDEKAMQWLEKAVQERSTALLSPRVTRALEALSTHPRFDSVMAASGAPKTRVRVSVVPLPAPDTARTPARLP